MKIQHASLDDFELRDPANPDFFTNPREHIDKHTLRELADMIETENGLTSPLRCVKRRGKLLVIGGSRRYHALRLLAEEKRAGPLADKVPYRLEGKLSAQDARVAALTDNLHRENLSSYEVAKQLAALKRAGKTQQEIGELIHKSQSYVSRMLGSFTRAAPAVLTAWKQGKLADDHVQQLSKLGRKGLPEQEKRLAKLLAHQHVEPGKPGKQQAKSAAKAAARGQTPGQTKAPATAPTPTPVPATTTTTTTKPVAGAVPNAAVLRGFVDRLADIPSKAAYLHGMRDGLRFALGELGPGEFADDYQKFAVEATPSTDRPTKPQTKPQTQTKLPPKKKPKSKSKSNGVSAKNGTPPRNGARNATAKKLTTPKRKRKPSNIRKVTRK